MDFVNQWFGDKPLATGSYLRANADSPWAAFSTHVDLSTQTSRGQSYASSLSSLRSLQYSATGSQPIIGVSWWQYTDNRAEKANWGLVTLLDNAYDGQEDVSGIVKCSAPLQSYSCGGEAANYGDVITSVRTANLFWLSH
jgi:hypothetical protein